MSRDSTPRRLSDYERAVIRRLLERPFAGVEEARLQAEHALARDMQDEQGDNYGTIELLTCPRAADAFSTLIIEASSNDSDGTPVTAILHARRGVLRVLEFLKEDGTPLRAKPAPETFVVTDTYSA